MKLAFLDEQAAKNTLAQDQTQKDKRALKRFVAITLYVIILAPILAIMIGEPISRMLGADYFWDMMIQIAVFFVLCVPLRFAIAKPTPPTEAE